MFLTFNDLDIPAGAENLRFDALGVTKNPSKLVTFEPRNWHGLGSRSMDDMFFFLGRFVGLTEEQYEEEFAARQRQQLSAQDN